MALCAQAPGSPVALPNIHQIDLKMDRMVGLGQVLEYLSPLGRLLEGATSRLLVRCRALLTRLTDSSDLLLQMVRLGMLYMEVKYGYLG